MQPRPSATELLAIVTEVINDEIVPALTGPAQHHARVAANIVAIVERELRLAPDLDAAERERIGALLDIDPDHDERDLAALRSALAEQLRAGAADDPPASDATWAALMESVRADLRIARPGHDTWQGD